MLSPTQNEAYLQATKAASTKLLYRPMPRDADDKFSSKAQV